MLYSLLILFMLEIFLTDMVFTVIKNDVVPLTIVVTLLDVIFTSLDARFYFKAYT